MREKIQEALKSSRADYTEIRLEEKESTNVAFRGKNLETAQATIDVGGVVRCLVKDRGWGVATFNNLDDLKARVEQAYQCARVAHTDEPIELAPIPVIEEHITAQMEHDFRDISMAAKKALAESYNDIMLKASDKIVDTFCQYGDSFNRMIFANSEGTYLEEERPMVAVACACASHGTGTMCSNPSSRFPTRQDSNMSRGEKSWLKKLPGVPWRCSTRKLWWEALTR